jgi:tripartite ATP-independent transporter DctP family solute receptor
MEQFNTPISRRALLRAGQFAAIGAVAAPWVHARAQGAKVIRLAHHVSLQSEQHKAAENFASLVQKYSNGALTVRVLPAAQAGGQREAIESVSLGALEMAYGESGLYANNSPRFGVVGLPYLYRDLAHWASIVDGPVGTGLAAELQKSAGLRIMNWMIGGYRDTYSRTRAIRKPEDFAGMKLRLPEAPAFVRSFRALGAIPTPIPAPEVYSALQTGVVDAMEGTNELAYTFKIFEVTKFMSRTRHMILDGSFAMNQKFYDSLPKDLQAALDRASQECTQQQRKEHVEREAMWFGKLKNETKIEINDVDTAAFAAKLTPLHTEFASAAKATDILAAIKKG